MLEQKNCERKRIPQDMTVVLYYFNLLNASNKVSLEVK
jgi:hypothetical protein